MRFEIIGICGSIRLGSFNRKLLELADEFAGDQAHIDIVDLRQIPMYDPDAELLGTPETVLRLRRQVAAANAVLFACPVYYVSIPGVLKNAIDWICRTPEPKQRSSVLAHKPVAVLGGGGGLGSLDAQNQLKEILDALDANLMTRPIVDMSRIVDRVGDDGYLKKAADRTLIKEFMSAFIEHIGGNKRVTSKS
ncbi:MAG: NAD(P)H-dependent oxidoreductase [Chloroflexi bacterium]|nr:NAD(P)H-dependent oxidoreductase [Chloroflexota bacterium]